MATNTRQEICTLTVQTPRQNTVKWKSPTEKNFTLIKSVSDQCQNVEVNHSFEGELISSIKVFKVQ